MKLNWLSPSLFSTFMECHHYYGLVRPCTESGIRLAGSPLVLSPLFFLYKFPCSDKMPESESCRLCAVCRLASFRLLPLNFVPGLSHCPGFDRVSPLSTLYTSSSHIQLSDPYLTNNLRLFLVVQYHLLSESSTTRWFEGLACHTLRWASHHHFINTQSL